MMIDEVANDAYLPVQVPYSHGTQPVQKLWLAVLNRALMDSAGGSYTSKDLESERAADWLGSESEEPGSFLWVSAHLGLCPKMIRSRLPEKKIQASRSRSRLEWRA